MLPIVLGTNIMYFGGSGDFRRYPTNPAADDCCHLMYGKKIPISPSAQIARS